MSSQQKFTIIIPPQDITCSPGCLIKLANGDREAYAWIYKNYCKKVYDYALLITGNEAVSEDIVQEVFLKLWQHRAKLKLIKDFNGYLYILYRNLITDVLKGQQKEISAKQEYYRDAVPSYVTADEIISYRDKVQVVAKAVKQLPKQQQMVYRLTRECGWKREEIARELHLSPFTIKCHLQNALRFLKKQLSE